MTLHAADAATLLVETAEAGGTAVVALVVGQPPGVDASREADVVGRRVAWARTRDGAERVLGSLGDERLDAAALEILKATADDPRSEDRLVTRDGPDGPVELFVEICRPVQELVVVGAGHLAQPLSHLGALLGFRVIVLDDRPDFATRERFPDAERVLRVGFDDPFAEVALHERTHIVLVTRGHKYDYGCLLRALRADPPPAYIGMIGSRRRVRATYVQLLEDGIDRALLGRIHAPVGLDVGAETPEEIAVAVAAELVQARRGGSGAPLKEVARVAERSFSDENDDA